MWGLGAYSGAPQGYVINLGATESSILLFVNRYQLTPLEGMCFVFPLFQLLLEFDLHNHPKSENNIFQGEITHFWNYALVNPNATER